MPEARRDALLFCYQRALAAVDGAAVVRRALGAEPQALPCALLAIGKAAPAMARGALDVLGSGVERALVITRHGYGEPLSRNLPVTCLEAGHPLPDAGSLQAGAALLAFLDDCPAELPLLCLISGGSSALVEVLPDGVDLERLQRLNRWLLGSGLSITEMNGLRKRVSCIKGGRLVGHLKGRRVRNLLLSDVAGDRLDAIGSGLLAPDPLAARESVDRSQPPLPDWVTAMVAQAPPVPAYSDPLFGAVDHRIVANNRSARRAAAAAGGELGFAVHHRDRFIEGDVDVVMQQLLGDLGNGPPGLYVYGGEATVRLPAQPGRGGRCQHLALGLARELRGRTDLTVLCAATDGADGPGDDAGAVVDGATLQRGEQEGLDASACLRGADAGSFLESSGDLLDTGPTGSNVNDLFLAIKAGS